MKSISLAAKYRPQSFIELVGQETIRNILSKAVAEKRVAPAYLLSGTRGVGKTTIARILAKALNCENADKRKDGEPCNTCDTCKRITQNAYVDVMEIDGASNRGIEEAKKIRDVVQYAPIEGKYRVIIIDEAHMLTKEAFNALLKTLEEPPAHTRFVLATTEAHKFPITIISRCQHFVFKQVSDKALEAHLKHILDKEEWQYEENAVQLLVKRANGSVRDMLSLLDQSLALAQNPLTEKLIRSILGLAGTEIIENLLNAIYENNVLSIVEITQEMLSQGIDIAYFLREFAQMWRTFFLIKQYDEKTLNILQLSAEVFESYKIYANRFSPSLIHSAWQMTLDSQRRITTSLEPGVALELFLINIALLPKLLPLKELDVEQIPQDTIEDIKKKSNNHLITKENDVDTTMYTANKKEPLLAPVMEEAHPTELLIDTSIIDEPTQEIQEELPKTEEIFPETQKNEENTLSGEAFLDFLIVNEHTRFSSVLKQCVLTFEVRDEITIAKLQSPSYITTNKINAHGFLPSLQEILQSWAQRVLIIEVATNKSPKARHELMKELEQKEKIQEIQTVFNAYIIHCENKKID